MSQIEKRFNRKRKSIQINSLDKVGSNRVKLANLNISDDLETKTSVMLECSSDSNFKSPNVFVMGTDKSYLDLNKFKMFDKLGNRREPSRCINKVSPI